MKKYLSLYFILMALTTFGQDSLSRKAGYKKWTNEQTSFRFGIGLQKSFSTEIGLSRHKYVFNDLGYASTAYYLAAEWIPHFSNSYNPVYGLKTGYEINARGLALGLETKYQTDFSNNDLVFIPKIGIGVLGVFNLFYGYQLSTNKSPFEKISNHQFSMVLNFNRKYLKSLNK